LLGIHAIHRASQAAQMRENRRLDSNPGQIQVLKFIRRIRSLGARNKAILMHPDSLPSESLMWLMRAEQARRIAAMLSGEDADRVWSYARECETNAMLASAPLLAA
jgi:hypothetical protein